MKTPQGMDCGSLNKPHGPSVGRCLRLAWVIVALAIALCPQNALVQESGDPPRPVMTPGEEIRIDDPQTGGLGYWTLYLPTDYTADRTWPIIFNFHGLDQTPNSWPFAQLTGQKGFIIVGLEYLQRGLDSIDRAEEAENLKRVVKIVSSWFPADEQLRLVGGFSKGGWHSSNMAERTSELWASVVILGAGRSATPSADGLGGKSVFIGAGENDLEHASAEAAAGFYEGLGAKVTFVTFEGVGHTVDVDDPTLRQWLQDNASAQRPPVSDTSPGNNQ